MSKCPHCGREVFDGYGHNIELLTLDQVNKIKEARETKENRFREAQEEYRKFRKVSGYGWQVMLANTAIYTMAMLVFLATAFGDGENYLSFAAKRTGWSPLFIFSVFFLSFMLGITMITLWIGGWRLKRFFAKYPQYKDIGEGPDLARL